MAKFDIDLLHPVGSQPKLYIQIFRWLLGTGRFIVVFVEIIVIGAFVSRFKLDTDLSNIQDQIKEQIPYVQSLKKDEILIRQTQFQLLNVKQLRPDNPNYTQLVSRVAASMPPNTKLSSLNFDRTTSFPKTQITLTGQAPSNLELAALLKALQEDTTFSDTALTNISYDKLSVIFTITANLTE